MEYADLEVRLETERLDQAALATQTKGQYAQAKAQLNADRQLAEEGLLDALSLEKSEVAYEQLGLQVEIEDKRLAIRGKAVAAQLAAKRARINQLHRLLDLRKQKLSRLKVRAGMTGVLQLMEVEVGQLCDTGCSAGACLRSAAVESGTEDRRIAGKGRPRWATGDDRHAQRSRGRRSHTC